MTYYKHILVGLDLSQESQQVIDHVSQLFEGKPVKISLLHIQEPLSLAYGGDIPMDLSEIQRQMEVQAKNSLNEIKAQLSQFNVVCHVIIGQPAHEMHRFAQENAVDLIVVGSYGRHGLALIFGSTANGVLHGASCDVLAVRIKEED
ncbi:MAG: universal stress protein [Porticoccaceae bacterium]